VGSRTPATRLESASNVARPFALFFGLGYLVVGVVGFAATGFDEGIVANTDDALFGIFDLNIFHNIVHMAIGAGLIVASRANDATVTQGIVIGLGLFYTVAAGLGFLNYLQIISIDTSLAPDNFLHLASALLPLIFGLIAVRQQSRNMAENEPPHTRAGIPVPAGGPAPLEERRGLWDEGDVYREETY